jgi:hypothetical protein
MQVLASQRGVKICDEPLNLRREAVRNALGVASWEELYDEDNRDRVIAYLRKIADGRLAIHNISPLHAQHRFLTDRVVFKIIHGGEGWPREIADGIPAKPLLLLRHPVPVSISRKQLPRVDALLRSDHMRLFTPQQIAEAQKVVGAGEPLGRAVVSWCLQASPFLRNPASVDLVLTYEQMVLRFEPIIDLLMEKLALENRAEIVAAVARASTSTRESDVATRQVLDQAPDEERNRFLVTKWHSHISSAERSLVQSILDLFEITAYRADQLLPHPDLWLSEPNEVPERIEADLLASLESSSAR